VRRVRYCSPQVLVPWRCWLRRVVRFGSSQHFLWPQPSGSCASPHTGRGLVSCRMPHHKLCHNSIAASTSVVERRARRREHRRPAPVIPWSRCRWRVVLDELPSVLCSGEDGIPSLAGDSMTCSIVATYGRLPVLWVRWSVSRGCRHPPGDDCGSNGRHWPGYCVCNR